MSKRKRESESADAEVKQPEQTGIRQLRAEQKLHHGQKMLSRAFKTAKGFERQKLGRRRKTASAKDDDKDLARIDAETVVLKTLDLAEVALIYLAKSLLKFKAVAQSPDLPRPLTQPHHQPQDPAALNVIARLCNSNPVREALPAILRDIQQALGIAVPEDASKPAKRLRAKDYESHKVEAETEASDDGEHGTDDDAGNYTRISKPGKQAEDSESFNGFSDDERDIDGIDDDEEAFAAYDARIAASSDDDESDDDALDFRLPSASESSDDEDESSSTAEKAPHEPQKGAVTRPKPLSASLSPSPSPSASPEPTVKHKRSAFMPSLTMGGYISGGSGSEAEDLSDDDRGAQKKNRRGQRARQAIWEKKFGKNAKHVQSGGPAQARGGKNEGRNEGWDPKRGATDGSHGRGRSTGGGRGQRAEKSNEAVGENRKTRRAGAGTAANLVPVKKRERDDQGSLHPSWEAAKKAKLAKAAVSSFQGKKITFD